MQKRPTKDIYIEKPKKESNMVWVCHGCRERLTKETCKRDLHRENYKRILYGCMYGMRMWFISTYIHMVWGCDACKEQPTKETCKRDLQTCKEKPTKETCKRDLQKSPTKESRMRVCMIWECDACKERPAKSTYRERPTNKLNIGVCMVWVCRRLAPQSCGSFVGLVCLSFPQKVYA